MTTAFILTTALFFAAFVLSFVLAHRIYRRRVALPHHYALAARDFIINLLSDERDDLRQEKARLSQNVRELAEAHNRQGLRFKLAAAVYERRLSLYRDELSRLREENRTLSIELCEAHERALASSSTATEVLLRRNARNSKK